MPKLLDFFVDFFPKGQENVKAAMESVQEASKASGEIVAAIGKEMAAAYQQAATAAQALANAVQNIAAQATAAAGGSVAATMGAVSATKQLTAVGVAAGVVYAKLAENVAGYVRAGIAATNIGDQINLQMQQISLSIAGLFRPELEKLVSGLRAAADWFRNLSEATRETIARWIGFSAIALGLAVIIPRIVVAYQALAVAIKAVSAALAAGSVAGLALVFAGAAAAAVYFQDGLSGLWEAIKPVVDVVATFATTLADVLRPVLVVVGNALVVVVKAISGLIEFLKPALQLVAAFAASWVTWLVIVPAIVAAIWSVVTALRAMIASMITTLALMGPKGWAKLGAGLAAAGIGIAAANALNPGDEDKKTKDNRSPYMAKVGGPEDITAAFSRLNVASLNATADLKATRPQEEILEEIAKNTGKTVNAIESKDQEYSTTRDSGNF